MTDDTKPFKLDVLRIERIKAQLDRGEKLSDEDREYLRECIRVFVEMIPPLIKAIKKALEELGRRLQQYSARRTPAVNVAATCPATKVDQFISFSGTDPTALDPAIRDRVINKERRNYR